MPRLFTLLGLRRPAHRAHHALDDAHDSESGVSSGWHESSQELRRGLTVLEEDEIEPDHGPETRPCSYWVETA